LLFSWLEVGLVEKDAVSKDFRKQVLGYGLTTAEIVYRRPDRHWLLQTYVWQDYDLFPNFPALKPRVLGKITRRTPVRSYRCALETHQASRTTRRRRRVPVALTQLEQLRPNCGSEVKSVRRPDRRKLPNGFTVDVEVKSTQAEHLRDRNPITFDPRNVFGRPNQCPFLG
jgi:Usg-like family